MRSFVKLGAGVAAGAMSITLAYSQGVDPLVARGDYLVNGILACGNCHTPRGPDGMPVADQFLAGGFEFNEMPAFHAYARNITPDIETGIGTWTDAEIARAIREGVTPEGEVGPPMPVFFFNRMSDDDVAAVVAYLRSIPAVRNEIPDATYNIPKPLPGPAAGLPAPPATDTLAYGEYLGTLAHCMDCHTPRDETGAPNFAQAGAGGFLFQETPLGPVLAANITNDAATGLGNWTDDELRRALTEGISRNGEILFPVMPYAFFHTLVPGDVDALIAWLRTVPAVTNEVAKVDWMTAMGIPRPPG